MNEKLVKLSVYKKLEKTLKVKEKQIIMLAETLCDIRSDMTCKPPYKNQDWAIDKICIVLDKLLKMNKELKETL